MDPVFTLRGHSHAVHAVAFSADGDLLCTGDENGNVKVWSLLTFRVVRRFDGLHGEATVLTCLFAAPASEGRRVLFTHGRDGLIRRTEFAEDDAGPSVVIAECNELSFSNMDMCTDPPLSMLYHVPKDDANAICASTISVSVDDASPGLPSHRYVSVDHKAGSVMRIRAVQRLGAVVGAYESGQVLVFDMQTAAVLHACRIHSEPLMGLDATVVHGSLIIICGSVDDRIALISVAMATEGAAARTATVATQAKGNCCVAVRDDARLVVVGNWSGYARVHAVGRKSLPFLAKLSAEEQLDGKINCIACAPTASAAEATKNMIAAGGKNGDVALWKIY